MKYSDVGVTHISSSLMVTIDGYDTFVQGLVDRRTLKDEMNMNNMHEAGKSGTTEEQTLLYIYWLQ